MLPPLPSLSHHVTNQPSGPLIVAQMTPRRVGRGILLQPVVGAAQAEWGHRETVVAIAAAARCRSRLSGYIEAVPPTL